MARRPDQAEAARSDPPSLTVAWSTRGARALALDARAWPPQAGVDHLVLVQQAGGDSRIGPHLETLAERADIRVIRLDSTGLARSRNAALNHVTGEIVLIADDDVTHPPGAYQALRRAFAAEPGLSLVAGRSFRPDGTPRKPGQGGRARRMTRLNAARISSHELAFRRAPILAAGIRFDESFGAGAGTATFLGEEYIFAADCLKAGLKGRHLPIPVSVHPPESSGFVWTGAAVARARAGVLARVFGPWAPLARFSFAAKNLRRFGSLADLGVFLSGR